MILGLSGKALAGKDTIADYLLKEHNWSRKMAFASNLKEACKVIFNLSNHQVFSQEGKKSLLRNKISLSEQHVVAIVNWMKRTHNISLNEVDFYKYLGAEFSTPREILQYVGTEIMRAYVDNYHMDVVVGEFTKFDNVVVTDVRFSNEAQSILDCGGVLVRVERDAALRCLDGAQVSSNHASEVALDDWKKWDHVIYNNYSFSELYKQIEQMLEEHVK